MSSSTSGSLPPPRSVSEPSGATLRRRGTRFSFRQGHKQARAITAADSLYRSMPPPAVTPRGASLPAHRRGGRLTVRKIRRWMSELRVVDLPVLDLIDPAVREAVGVTEARLRSNDYPHCRRVADLVWSRSERY